MFPKIILKGCPKCQGDLSKQKDRWGEYWSCLQCGLLIEIKNTIENTLAVLVVH